MAPKHSALNGPIGRHPRQCAARSSSPALNQSSKRVGRAAAAGSYSVKTKCGIRVVDWLNACEQKIIVDTEGWRNFHLCIQPDFVRSGLGIFSRELIVDVR